MSQAREDALQALKQYLATTMLLSKPRDGEALQLYLTVSNASVSVVLTREDEN